MAGPFDDLPDAQPSANSVNNTEQTTQSQTQSDNYIPFNGGVVTSYGYSGDSTPDWNSSHGIGAFTKHLIPGQSFGTSYDVENALRDAGIKPGESVNLHLSNGQTVTKYWHDRGATDAQAYQLGIKPERGRFDFYSPQGPDKLSGVKVVGFSPANGSQNTEKDPFSDLPNATSQSSTQGDPFADLPNAQAQPTPTPQTGGLSFAQGTYNLPQMGGLPTPQPTPQAQPNVFDQALAQYPILKNANPVGMMSTNATDSGNMLESWPVGEQGTQDRPRPQELPNDKLGVQIFSSKTTPNDVAADIVSHALVKTDPTLKATYDQFASSITPEQKDFLMGDYENEVKQATLSGGEKPPQFDQWLQQVGIPAAFRGYAFNQYNPQDQKAFGYTDQQKQLLGSVKPYLQGGQQQAQPPTEPPSTASKIIGGVMSPFGYIGQEGWNAIAGIQRTLGYNEAANQSAQTAAESVQDWANAFGGTAPAKGSAAATAGQIGGAAISFPGLAMTGLAGAGAMIASGYGNIKEDLYNKYKEQGLSDQQANQKSTTHAAITTIATLPAYILGGKAAGKVADKFISEATPKLIDATARFGFNTVANSVASAVVRGMSAAMEGEDPYKAAKDITLGSVFQDALFAGHSVAEHFKLEAAKGKAVDEITKASDPMLKILAKDKRYKEIANFEIQRRKNAVAPKLNPSSNSSVNQKESEITSKADSQFELPRAEEANINVKQSPERDAALAAKWEEMQSHPEGSPEREKAFQEYIDISSGKTKPAEVPPVERGEVKISGANSEEIANNINNVLRQNPNTPHVLEQRDGTYKVLWFDPKENRIVSVDFDHEPTNQEIENAQKPTEEPTNATETRKVEEGNQPEHPNGDQGGEATETSGGNRSVEGGEEPQKEEVIPEGPQKNADNLDRARARIQADPTLPEKLIARIIEGGLRQISDQDVFTLLAHEENLKAQEDQWRKQYLDDNTSDIDRATAEGKLDQLEKDLTRTSQAIDKAGSIKGRGLQALKLRAMEDFSEDAILYRMRKSKGDALTPEEKNQAKDIANRYAELQKKEDQINQKREEAEQTTELSEAYQNALKEIEDLKAKAKKLVKEPTKKQASQKPALDQRIVNKLNALAEKVRQERKGKLYARISPVDIGDVIIGASHIANGLKSFKDWSVKMVEELGERVKPHLDRLWEAANAKIDSLSKGNTPEDVRARIKAEAVAGEELSPKSVGDLVKAHLEEGLRGENEVMQAVHEDVKEAYPDATERDVRRAFVDFNKEFKPLSKDEILTRTRQLKTLVRLQENIDRLEEGLPALKATDRDKAIQEIRDKRKQLNDLLAKTKQPTAEEHFATQNEAKKTRLRNAIEDLEKQLETGERPNPKVREEEPQEIEDLRLEKEALQRLRDEVDRREAPKFSPEERENERLRKQYEKQIAELDEKLQGIEKPKAEKEQFQQSVENEQRMAERDAMREKLKEIEKEEAERNKPTPEQKEIERLQKAIDDVNDKISKLEKNAPKEKKQPLTEYAKKLQDDLKKAREQFRRVTGEVPKTPEQRYNEQRRKAWQKEIDRLKDKMNRKDFSEQPKKPKPILDQESRRVFDEKEKVKQEAREMEQRLQHESRTPVQKAIDRFIKIPYHFLTAIKVLGHGTVGMITHAGGLIWRPTRAGIYWRNFFRQFPLWLRPKYHARIIYDLIHDPEFQTWKDAGASIDPREEYTDYGMYAKWMGKFAAGGKRGFDALNLVRLEMNKKDWERAPDEIKNNPEQAEAARKYIAATNNKATGALPQGYSAGRQLARNPYMDWLFFAPKLYATRFSRVLFDPVRTIKTFGDWKSATPAEKYIALKRLRNAAEFSATYIGALLVNQALLQQTGSKQQVNFTDPSKTDWLKFKIGNKVIMADGGLLDPIRLIGRVVYGDLIKPRTEREAYLKGNRYQQAMKDLTEYVRGKFNPTLGIITDISTGTDFQGRPLPAPLNRGEKAKYADQPQYTWKEWLLEQGPIPLSGATKDVYESMREKGLSDAQAQDIIKGAALTAVGMTGAHAQEDYSLLPKNPPRKSRSSSSNILDEGGRSGGSSSSILGGGSSKSKGLIQE